MGDDFYEVLGLKKECSSAGLRLAYKKLALKWHPDRFCASGDPKYMEKAKKKFQGIQQAYSVAFLEIGSTVACVGSGPILVVTGGPVWVPSKYYLLSLIHKSCVIA